VDSQRFDRRELMRRGGKLAVATSAASLVTFDRLAEQVDAAPPLRKCISLGGFVHQDNHPDDYRLWGNREYIRDQSRTTWVKLWVGWHALQAELTSAPQSRAASWAHLNTAPGGQSWLRYLDRQVKAINDDGLGCLLSVDYTVPTWASGATGVDPVSTTKADNRKVPLDLSANGPWAWLISHLIARYRKGAATNAVGPHEPGAGENGALTRFGNPDGGFIDALEICTEPNQLWWPQEGIAAAIAQMIRTAEQLSYTWGPTPIVAPATSDFPDTKTTRNSRGIVYTWWFEFTRRVLEELHGFHPRVPVRWSHHNYRETRFGEAPKRCERVLWLLGNLAGWRLERQPLWLTEGGINMSTRYLDPAERENQARVIERSFRRSMHVPEIFMWTQHTINDKQWNSWKGGLRDDFTWEQGVGPPRPAWYTWRDLPGSPTR
jgi:hypothetical protein